MEFRKIYKLKSNPFGSMKNKFWWEGLAEEFEIDLEVLTDKTKIK